MDALSRLLQLYPPDTGIDLRCRFGTPSVLDHAAQTFGVAPYHVILDGAAKLVMPNASDASLRPGDIVVFPHGTAHRLHIEGQGKPRLPRPLPSDGVLPLVGTQGNGPPTDILCGEFRFAPHAARVVLPALPEVFIVQSAGRSDFSALHALITMLRHETGTLRAGSHAVVSQLGSALFALVMRAWLEDGTASAGLFALLGERRLAPAVLAMFESPEKPWTLDSLAQRCSMSRATFARVFQRAAGDTPARVLQQVRMARALAWLAEGKDSIGAIAEGVGYQSEAAFSRVFTRSFGVGPGHYRRATGKKSARGQTADGRESIFMRSDEGW
ncbi:AraC family transcriptional regulator [Oxalobacteraceae bacterium OM1]|nr:AraC family transcriptional regulator [Oxalobacteraceae bacterium OM1]